MLLFLHLVMTSSFYVVTPKYQFMATKISLNIPDDTYKELSELADFYKLDVKNAILSTLATVGKYGDSIIKLGKEYKVQPNLDNVMSNMLSLSESTHYSIDREVLDCLKAKA